MDLHAVGGSKAGLTSEQIAAVKAGSWRGLSDFSDGERLALELAEGMAVTPPSVNQQLIERLSEHYAPDQIVEMVATCAWENFQARFNRGLGIEGHGFYRPE